MKHTAAMLKIDSYPIEGFYKDAVHKIIAQENNIDIDKNSCSLI